MHIYISTYWLNFAKSLLFLSSANRGPLHWTRAAIPKDSSGPELSGNVRWGAMGATVSIHPRGIEPCVMHI